MRAREGTSVCRRVWRLTEEAEPAWLLYGGRIGADSVGVGVGRGAAASTPPDSPITCAKNLKKYHLENLIVEKRMELQKIEKKGDKENKEAFILKDIRNLGDEMNQLKKGEVLGR